MILKSYYYFIIINLFCLLQNRLIAWLFNL